MTALDASTPIVVSLEYSPDDDQFLVRVPTEYRDSLNAAFRAAGLHPLVRLQESAAALPTALLFLQAVGDTATIALAVREFSRGFNKATTIKVRSGRLKLEATGYDAEGIALILSALKGDPGSAATEPREG